MRPAWRNRKHPKTWLSSLERYAFPRIGKMPVSEVSSADVLEVLSPIWHVKGSMARCVRRRIRAVMEWAVAMELRPDNPCDRIGPVLGPQRDLVQHMQALPHREVASAIETVRASGARLAVKLAFEFLVLTAARSGEVRGAVWSEMDRDGSVWTVPATRMKTHREHRVPLCRRALEILEEARALGNGGRFVFPSVQPGKQLGDMMLSGLLKDLKIAAVPHGFRSSFRDWAAEETNHPREVIEAALAHVVRNPVEAAYAHSDLFERRRRLMDDWAGYLAGPSRGPQAGAAFDGLPARDHCGGSDPEKGRGGGEFWRAPPPPPRCRTSAKKPGVAPSTSSPSRTAPRGGVRGGGHAMPAPHKALPHRIRRIRANPRPMRVSGNSLDHDGEGCAL